MPYDANGVWHDVDDAPLQVAVAQNWYDPAAMQQMRQQLGLLGRAPGDLLEVLGDPQDAVQYVPPPPMDEAALEAAIAANHQQRRALVEQYNDAARNFHVNEMERLERLVYENGTSISNLRRQLAQIQIDRAHGVEAQRLAAEDAAAEKEEETALAQVKLVNEFPVGCDPEFAILDADGGLIYVNGNLRHEGAIGYDHGGRLVELRPRASRSTYKLVQNIRKLLVEDKRLESYRSYKWRRGGLVKNPRRNGDANEPLGGHVHLGVSPDNPKTPAIRDIAAACDALTKVYEHLDILPTVESKARRDLNMGGGRGDHYGAFGNLVATPYNAQGARHLEYRTPCSWLHKPEAAFFVLTGYKLAAKNPKVATEHFATVQAKTRPLLNLRDFYDGFRAGDDDVRRFRETLRVRQCVGDPTEDFQGAWREMKF